nr:hypothetical protein [Bacillus sp. SG-1]
MKEYIGECQICRKPLYCLDGFFNGIHDSVTKKLICFNCTESQMEVENDVCAKGNRTLQTA